MSLEAGHDAAAHEPPRFSRFCRRGGGCVAVPRPALAQAPPRVVVVGGGFAGATAARALKKADPDIPVTLVEANATFTACPFSNLVIAGLRDLKAQQFTYEKMVADGIVIAAGKATGSIRRRAA